MEPRIIYEEKGFAVVDKPTGLLVHAVKRRAVLDEPRQSSRDWREERSEKQERKEEPTLVDWLLKKYPEIKTVGDDPGTRPGIVHRLDKDTSGAILVARTQEDFEYFKSLFQKREIKKTYLAVVFGAPSKKEGIIESDISLKSGTTKRTVHGGKMTKPAVTEYKILKSVTCQVSGVSSQQSTVNDQWSLLEVHPLTGRTHQIRVHLASIGNPIVGDVLYGKKKLSTTSYKLQATRLMLHALSLEFSTKEGKRLRIEAEQPKEFSEWH